MEIYTTTGTNKLPEINFDPAKSIFSIKGRSIPEHPVEFYQPLVEILSAHSASTLPKCTVSIYLEYFNTSSSRCLFVILKKFKELKIAGSLIEVVWAYQAGDESMLEAGKDFEDFLEFPFKLLEVGA